MAEPAKRIPRIVAVEDAQRCFDCADTEARRDLSRTLMLAEIRRLEAELERAHVALRRDSHVMDPREPHRKR